MSTLKATSPVIFVGIRPDAAAHLTLGAAGESRVALVKDVRRRDPRRQSATLSGLPEAATLCYGAAIRLFGLALRAAKSAISLLNEATA